MNDFENTAAQQSAEKTVELAVSGGSLIRGQVRNIPFRLSVTIPLLGWRLLGLRDLRQGQLLLTGVSAAEDVPVSVGDALLGHAELDNVDGQMAVRLTRLD
ncbi:FliM/FliN family flagellar motor C-terminal domain-containing protein [Terriglobus sp. RCC_193]|uniref:FliM/FliN family flagellar motor C-terminal domain-containing protein n=1 Tax=Terriglobus sp. RCC_193 TaxID=3239218 RepID=UPI0035237B60